MAAREGLVARDGGRVRDAVIRRFASNFFVVYLVLYSLASQIVAGLILFSGSPFRGLGTIWPMRDFTEWVGVHIFHVTSLAFEGTSADTPFHWVQIAWLLVASALIAAVVRRKLDGPYVRLFFRFALAAQMFYFGLAKVIPTQFPPPSLVTLLTPAGDLAPDGLLWTFIGSSPAYEMITGWAELVAGVLLIVPRTAAIGAVIALIDMIQVWLFNMTYDVGLKTLSFHLILISAFLLAPHAARVARALTTDAPSVSRRTLTIQIAFGVYLLVMFTRLAMLSWVNPGGPGAPKSPLYGIWNIQRLSVDGDFRPPAMNDYDRRWRRVIFDAPDLIVFQRTDDSFAHYGATIDTERGTIELGKIQSRLWRASFNYMRPSTDQLVLDGDMDGHNIHAELQLLPMDVFKLTNGTFRWVRPAS